MVGNGSELAQPDQVGPTQVRSVMIEYLSGTIFGSVEWWESNPDPYAGYSILNASLIFPHAAG